MVYPRESACNLIETNTNKTVNKPKKILLSTGIALVIANMLGAGVFLSTGFMAQELGPLTIMLAWAVGAVLALAGTLTYAGLIEALPKSGGEYRFLSDLLHPWVGYLAGWASVLVGFAAPIAVDALAAGFFLQVLFPTVQPKFTGVIIVLGLTMLHACDLNFSKWAQNWLVSITVLLIILFILLGLLAGNQGLPTWSPPAAVQGFSLAPFMTNLFYVMFAFTGWNAAVYAVEEFKKPKQDVPRAMFIGCSAVAVVYLLVNWIFVANINPEQAAIVFTYDAERVTLGHVVMTELIGTAGGKVMSGLLVVVFLSASSALVFSGPRVYAAMAQDGYLPHMLRAQKGKPPFGALILQCAIVLVILFTQKLQEMLFNIGAILMLFSALTAISLLWSCYKRRGVIVVSPLKKTAAVVFIVSTAYMFYYGLQADTKLVFWLIGIGIAGSFGFFLNRRARVPGKLRQ
jgi:APA family basic amino acid/polyamine antiporter